MKKQFFLSEQDLIDAGFKKDSNGMSKFLDRCEVFVRVESEQIEKGLTLADLIKLIDKKALDRLEDLLWQRKMGEEL